MSRENISVVPHDVCCGCKACGDACPKSCITYLKDSEGFLYPSVNDLECIHCGLCAKACPVISQKKHEEADIVYAALAPDKQMTARSSSGGIFPILALDILSKNGKVWGAAFCENLQLRHICITTKEELPKLQKSKYIQSDCSGVYKQIKRDLRAGIQTLFCGTPCQCGALLNYLGSQPDNLLIVDFVCHGVPSQDLFDKSIDWFERKNAAKVTAFEFRCKEHRSGNSRAFKLSYDKQGTHKEWVGLYYDFPYYYGFNKYFTLRPSCYQCRFSTLARCSDITLGDFWGIEKFTSEFDLRRGVSQLLCNTEKGTQMLNAILQNNNVKYMELPVQYAVNNNAGLTKPTNLSAKRDAFYQALSQQGFDYVAEVYLKSSTRWLQSCYFLLPLEVRNLIKKILNRQ